VQKQHRRTTLTSTPTYRIDRCSCGRVNLVVGESTLSMCPHLLARLRNDLSVAIHENRQASGDADPLDLPVDGHMFSLN